MFVRGSPYGPYLSRWMTYILKGGFLADVFVKLPIIYFAKAPPLWDITTTLISTMFARNSHNGRGCHIGHHLFNKWLFIGALLSALAVNNFARDTL